MQNAEGVAPAAAEPEDAMVLFRPAAERARVFFAFFAVLLPLFASAPSFAAVEFPYDRELILDAARMGRAKRVPMLIVSSNGAATIKLWCKDVAAQVLIAGNDIKIEPGPLPEALPLYMSDGQCSPERMQADIDTLAMLTQMSTWRPQSGGVVLAGAATLTFRANDH